MNIDLHTLAMAMTLTNVMQVIALFAQYRLDKTHAGPGWWTLANTATALAFGCTYLRDHPDIGSLATVGANAFFFFGMASYYVGFQRFLGRRERVAPLIAFCVVMTLVAFYYTYIEVNVGARLACLAGGVAILALLSARALFTIKTRAFAASAYFVAAVFAVQGAILTAVAVIPIARDVQGLFMPSVTLTAMYLNGLIISMPLTFGIIIMVNQRLNAESREAQENAELIFNTSPDAVVITRLTDGCFVGVNDGFTALSGYSRAEVIGKSTLDIHIWKDSAERNKLRATLKQHGFIQNQQAAFLRKDGNERMALISAKIIHLGEVPHLISVTRDITDRNRAEEAQRRTQELFSLFLRHSPIYAFIKEVTATESRVLQASDNYQEMVGISGRDMVGKTMSDLFPAEFAAKITAEDQAVVGNGKVLRLDEDLAGRNYSTIKFPIVQGDRTLLAGYTIDITERKRLEEQLHQQATTDELTGVTNRRRFIELAQAEMRRAIRLQRPLALALIDIDHFKQINDTHGHAAGDQALLMLAAVTQRNIRAIDVFARFGGDEFAVLMPETNREQACEVMDRVCMVLAAQPVDFGGVPFAITISSGVACLASGEESMDSLLKRADQALYAAKAAGRNRVMIESIAA